MWPFKKIVCNSVGPDQTAHVNLCLSKDLPTNGVHWLTNLQEQRWCDVTNPCREGKCFIFKAYTPLQSLEAQASTYFHQLEQFQEKQLKGSNSASHLNECQLLKKRIFFMNGGSTLKNLLLLEQILSIKSRPNLMKDFRMMGSNEKVTKVFSFWKKWQKGTDISL